MMIKQKNTNQVLVRDWANEHWLRFTNPRHVELIEDIGQVLPALQRIEKMVNQENLTAIGYISYEGSPAFDSALITHPADDFPLLWFGLYSKSEIFDLPTDDNHAPITVDWQPSVKRPDYDRAIDEIKHQIERGYTYQVNYTMRLRANFNHDPLLLFSRLASAQETEYAAYLDIGRYAICSLSPELFFELDGYRLHSKPMKGTAPRGRTQQEVIRF
jgi:para-aminobenzoate synthetase/4-amino-4-deoxychorismate lyase